MGLADTAPTWLWQLGFGLLVLSILCAAGVMVCFRRPQSRRSFQVAFIALLGASWSVLVIAYALVGSAMEFSRHVGWFSRDNEPIKFWISICFHLSLSFALLYGAFIAARLPIGTPLRGIANGDITVGFLSVFRWVFLVLAIAIAGAWVYALLRS